MQDRLQDLYAAQANVDTSRDYNDAEMIEIPIDQEKLEIPESLKTFNEQVDKLKLDITQLRSNVETLNSAFRSLLVSTETKNHEEHVKALEKQIDDSLRITAEALKRMNTENQEVKEHARWRANVHGLLTKRFMDVLLQYRHTQSDYREKVQIRIKQRLQIVRPDASQEEIQKWVDTGSLNIFAQQIQDTTQAQEALRYVEGRHREILKIEDSVNELHQLFNDMAVLVNAQGEYIDNIEANVAQSNELIITANKDLAGALKRKNRNRKCAFICCVISLVLLIAAIITIILVGNANGWFKKSGAY